MTTEYAEVGGLALLRQVARPVLVRLWEAEATVWTPALPYEWAVLSSDARERMVDALVSRARSRVLQEDRVAARSPTVWYDAEEDQWGRHSVSLLFVVAEPFVSGLTPDHITDAWDGGYRQIAVLPSFALPPGWPNPLHLTDEERDAIEEGEWL